MKTTIKLILSLAIILFASCKRQKLYNAEGYSNKATINLSLDWDESGIDKTAVQNVSIYAYPEAGDEPYVKISGDIDSLTINLPKGKYSILVFNEVVGDILGVELFDIDTYSRVGAESISRIITDDIYLTIEDGEYLVDPHERVATWGMDNFEVSEEMINCQYCSDESTAETQPTLDVVLTPVTTQCEVIVAVENLDNAHYIQAALSGLASGALLASQVRIAPVDQVNVYGLKFEDGEYDSTNSSDGVVRSQITTFGKSPIEGQNYTLDISVILNNGELVEFSRDVTSQIMEQTNAKIVIMLTSDENKIVLPEGKGTGFGVESWGDRTTVELK